MARQATTDQVQVPSAQPRPSLTSSVAGMRASLESLTSGGGAFEFLTDLQRDFRRLQETARTSGFDGLEEAASHAEALVAQLLEEGDQPSESGLDALRAAMARLDEASIAVSAVAEREIRNLGAGPIARSGIHPLDERIGGIRRGVYLLAGVPGSGHFTAVLQFLNAGLSAGERVALVTGVEPAQVFETAHHWGFPLEEAWRDGRLRLVGYQADFSRRIQHSAEPLEIFEELSQAVGDGVARLGIYPGTPIWETRSNPLVGQRFLEWADRHRFTVWGTLMRELGEGLAASTEWVLQGAAGVFELQQLRTGLLQLWVRSVSPPVELPGPITCALRPGAGLVTPTELPSRRSTDAPPGSERRLLMISLAPETPDDLTLWASQAFDVTSLTEPLELVPRLQDDAAFGTVLIYVSRDNVERAILACRAARPVTIAPIILASDQPLRASDRTRALQAGADEFLSGSIDLAELSCRIERARSIPRDRARQPRPSQAVAVRRGSSEALDTETFASFVRTRMTSEGMGFFVLARVTGPGSTGDAFRTVVLQQIRWESGDFAGTMPGGFGIVLEGSRKSQVEAFLKRLRRALKDGGDGSGLEFEILSNPADAARIRKLVRG